MDIRGPKVGPQARCLGLKYKDQAVGVRQEA